MKSRSWLNARRERIEPIKAQNKLTHNNNKCLIKMENGILWLGRPINGSHWDGIRTRKYALGTHTRTRMRRARNLGDWLIQNYTHIILNHYYRINHKQINNINNHAGVGLTASLRCVDCLHRFTLAARLRFFLNFFCSAIFVCVLRFVCARRLKYVEMYLASASVDDVWIWLLSLD